MQNAMCEETSLAQLGNCLFFTFLPNYGSVKITEFGQE